MEDIKKKRKKEGKKEEKKMERKERKGGEGGEKKISYVVGLESDIYSVTACGKRAQPRRRWQIYRCWRWCRKIILSRD